LLTTLNIFRTSFDEIDDIIE
jgi:hypothetical protein